MSKLKGKVAVVTGASKGIGAGIAKALAAEGASVVVNYASSKAGADAVVDVITKAGGKAVAVGGDVSKADQAKGIIDAAIKNFGRLDILVNNSGVYEFGLLEAVTEVQFHRMFNINVLGSLLTTQAALKHLGEGASIINIGSGVTRLTPPNSTVYTATKGALDAFTGVWARELGPRKIRVNSINPRRGRDRRYAHRRYHRVRFRKGPDCAGAAGAFGPGQRHRSHCGFPGVRGFRVVDRRAVFGYRGNSLIRAGVRSGRRMAASSPASTAPLASAWPGFEKTSSPVAQFFLSMRGYATGID